MVLTAIQVLWCLSRGDKREIAHALPRYGAGVAAATTFVRTPDSIGYLLPDNLAASPGRGCTRSATAPGMSQRTGGTVWPAALRTTAATRACLGYDQGRINTAIAYGRTTYAPRSRITGAAAGGTVLGLAGVPQGNFTDLNWGVVFCVATRKSIAY